MSNGPTRFDEEDRRQPRVEETGNVVSEGHEEQEEAPAKLYIPGGQGWHVRFELNEVEIPSAVDRVNSVGPKKPLAQK